MFGDKLNTDYLQMGFAIGDNYSNMTNIEGGNYSHNIALGLDLKIFPKNKISMHTGAFFSSPVSKADIPFISSGDPNLDSVIQNSSIELRLSYVSIPLYAKYNVAGNSVSLELGATLAYLRRAEKIYEFSNNNSSLSYKENRKDDFNKIDVQIGAGVGYAFKEGEGVRLKLFYLHSLKDVVHSEDLKIHPSKAVYNQIIQFMVEIPIKGAPME